MEFFQIEYSTLCTWLWKSRDKQKIKIHILMENIQNENNFSKDQLAQIKKKLNELFMPIYGRQWNSSRRNHHIFKQKYSDFMQKKFKVVFSSTRRLRHKEDSSSTLNSIPHQKDCGRPKLTFENSSDRTKRRKIVELRKFYSEEQIEKAYALNRRTQPVPTTDKEITNNTFLNVSLAMYMDLHLSRAKYETLREYNLLLFDTKTYPSYDKIRFAKQFCYPENIEISEYGASVKLQSLIDHTARRIVESLPTSELDILNGKEFVLYGKWGMDGASGQQTFKQRWTSSNSKKVVELEENLALEEISDKSIFMISMVPLQITSHDNEIMWMNDRPSSVRYCRPIKFTFMKETSSSTLQEYNYYMQEINNLMPTVVTIKEISITITHNLQCTMIDGKVCNVLTSQKSSASCNICGAKPNDMNNLDRVMALTENEENCKFGLSTLHCWIRFMECLLHVSYNLEFEKSYASGEHKILKDKRKKQIQTALKSELSISVDFVKQGFGTTNDGNTARRFFSEPEIVGKILGVNVNIIERFANILQVISSGFEIDTNKFKEYSLETAKLFIEHYGWYKMPPAVHKVLLHGSKIMQQFNVPIGRLSEEAQEANNKFFKEARAHNSRLCSRKASNEDVMHYLLVASDPVISSLRLKKDKKYKELSEKAKSLLKNVALQQTSQSEH